MIHMLMYETISQLISGEGKMFLTNVIYAFTFIVYLFSPLRGVEGKDIEANCAAEW